MAAYEVTGPQNTDDQTWYFCLTKPGKKPSDQPSRWVGYPPGQTKFTITVDQDGVPLVDNGTYVVNARLDPVSGVNDDTETITLNADSDIASEPNLPTAKTPTYGSYTIARAPTQTTYFALVPEGSQPRAEEGAWIAYPVGSQPIKATYGQDGKPLRVGDAYKLYSTSNQTTLADLISENVIILAEGGQPDPSADNGLIARWFITDLGAMPEFLLSKGEFPTENDEWHSNGTDSYTFFEDKDGDPLTKRVYLVFRRVRNVHTGADYYEYLTVEYDPTAAPSKGETLHSVMFRGRYTTLEAIMGGLGLSKAGQVGLTILNELLQPLATVAADGLYDPVKNPNGGNSWLQNESTGGYVRLLRDLTAAINGALAVTMLPHFPDAQRVLVSKTIGGLERFGYQTFEELAAGIVDYLPANVDESAQLPPGMIALGVSYQEKDGQGNPIHACTLWLQVESGVIGPRAWVKRTDDTEQPEGEGWVANVKRPGETTDNTPWNFLWRFNAKTDNPSGGLAPGMVVDFYADLVNNPSKVLKLPFTVPAGGTTGIQIISGTYVPPIDTATILRIDVYLRYAMPSRSHVLVFIKQSKATSVSQARVRFNIPPDLQGQYPQQPFTDWKNTIAGTSPLPTMDADDPGTTFPPDITMQDAQRFVAFYNEHVLEYYMDSASIDLEVKLGSQTIPIHINGDVGATNRANTRITVWPSQTPEGRVPRMQDIVGPDRREVDITETYYNPAS
jgi:hypothetical protein